MRTTRIGMLASLLLLYCGCTGVPPDEREEAVADQDEAVTAPPTWDAPACSSDALDSHLPVCQGPWKYSRALTEVGRDPYCGTRECIVQGTCSLWKNGYQAGSSWPEDGAKTLYTCVERCSTAPNGDCTNSCSPVLNATALQNACNNVATGRRNTLSAQLSASIDAEGGVGAASKANIMAQLSVTGSLAEEHISTTVTSNTKWITTTDKDRVWCQVNISYPSPRYAQSPSCPCAQSDWSSCEHPIGQTTEYSIPGAQKPTGQWLSQQQCTTCDDVPYADAAGVNQKYTCLQSSLASPAPPTTTGNSFRNAIIARLELLFEFRADLLTQLQRDAILSLYSQNVSYPTCELPVPVSDACRATADAAGMTGLLQSCSALHGDYVPFSVVDVQLPACLTLFDKTATLAAGACKDELRLLSADAVEAMIDRRFAAIVVQTGNLQQLPQSLGAIDDWYDHARLVDDGTFLTKRTSKLLGDFWGHVYAAGAPVPQSVTSVDVQQQLASLLETGLAADWAVLNAAFADESHLDSPPLLQLTADALRTTVDRLDTVSQLHDAACRYKGCDDNVDSTMTSQTWRLLADLLDASDLQSALDTGLLLKTAHYSLWNAIDKIRTHRARLQTAYTAAGGGDLATMFDATSVPADANALAVVIGGARERWLRYQNFGLFLSSGERPLFAGMQNKTLISTGITNHEAALNQSIANYVNTKVSVVNSLLAEMRGDHDADSMRDRMMATSRHISDVLSDLGGLQAREDEETRRYADYEKAFDAMHNAGVFDDQMAAQSDVLPPAMLSGANARWAGPGDLDISQIAAAGWKQTLSKGETLRMGVTGQWAPSCALQRSNVPGPTGGTYRAIQADALIGPEGYMMQWSNGDFRASGWSVDLALREFANAEACLEAEVGTPYFVKVFTGADIKLTMKACAGIEGSSTQQQQWSGGSDERQGASFSGGLHLPETPFPQSPAGALLLVVTQKDNPHNILDVQVVSRQMVYLASDDSDAYLVVNDVSKSSCTVRPDRISVEATKTTSFGAIAQKLKLAMADTLASIRQQTPALLEQGTLMASDATLIRQAAHQALALQLGFDLTELPAAVMEFYDTWLTASINSLERRVTIRQLQRDLARTFLDVDAIQRELKAAGEETRLLELVPRWTLRNLQSARIDVDAAATLRLLTDYVPPVLELRYSKALAILRSKPNNKVTPVLQLDFAAPMESAYAALDALALDVRDTIDFAQLDSADYGTAMAALAFPNPNRYGTGTPPPGCELLGTCELATTQPTMLWKTVEMERAEQVWAGLTGHGWSTFTVTPDDLYDPHGGNARLHCSDGAPVIRKVALFIVGDQTEYDNAFYRPPMKASREQVFPTNAGPQRYAKVDEDWLSMGLPVFGGAEGNAVQRVHVDTSHVGEGLSPFGRFDVDFTNFPFGTASISALVMVFELEPRPLAAPGVNIDACPQIMTFPTPNQPTTPVDPLPDPILRHPLPHGRLGQIDP